VSTLYLSATKRIHFQDRGVMHLAAGRTIVFVRQFDPTKHPRGYKGMFIETPDKRNAGDVPVGATIATKSGKAFQVTGHGAKGIKVASVDPDTGVVLNKSTVVANGIEVAVVEGAGSSPGTLTPSVPQITPRAPLRAPTAPTPPVVPVPPSEPPSLYGRTVAVGDMAVGAFVQNKRNGKRFEIAKHGNWVTVYPVDDLGERNGKHTVLPPTTQVTVVEKVNGGKVTPQIVQSIQQAQAAMPASVRAPKRGKPGKPGDFQTGYILRGIVATEGVDVDEFYRVEDVTPAGSPIVIGGIFATPTVVNPKLLTLERGEEQIPENLPKAPKPYATGVGRGTAVVIQEVPDISPNSGRTVAKKNTYIVKRVPDPNNPQDAGEVLAMFQGVGDARKFARGRSENHEAVLEQRAIYAKTHPYQVGEWVYHNGQIHKIAEVTVRKSWYAGQPDYHHLKTEDGRGFTQSRETLPIPDAKALESVFATHGATPIHGHLTVDFPGPLSEALLAEVKRQQGKDEIAEVRKARPNLFVSYLQDDYDPSELVGKSKREAMAVFRKLGYAEVEPREKDLTKLVNDRAQRINVAHPAGTIMSVDEIQYPRFIAASDGAAGFHRQLQAALDSGGDLSDLDPRAEGPEAANTITRTLLFDMATGKQNGVERQFKTSGATIKVKSDAKYVTEIEADIQAGKLSDLTRDKAAEKVANPGLNVPVRTDVLDTHFPGWQTQDGLTWTGNNVHLSTTEADGSETASVAIAMGERNGFAKWAAEKYGADYPEAVRQMAADYAIHKDDPGDPDSPWATWSAGQRQYVMDTLEDVEPRATRQWGLRETELTRRIDAEYTQGIATETASRRKAEGTVAVAPGSAASFEMPLWDDITFDTQDVGDVDALIQNATNNRMQVPMFFSGGLLKDGVAYGVKNSHRETSTSQGSDPKATGRPRVDAEVPHTLDDKAVQKMEAAGARRTPGTNFPNPHGHANYSISGGTVLRIDDGPDKYIEYIPHYNGQHQDVLTNQRGRLILEGFTAEEAAARLQDLGFVHELEDAVPFESVMRSKRRYGRVLPLHPDYISGKAPLPVIPSGIGHGMAGSNMDPVFESGGLLSIAERFRLGVPLNGMIPRNDVTAGVDHVVFAAMATTASAYGDINVVYKDSAYLRRDILMCDRIFNSQPGTGGRGRYPAYRDYHNARRRDAGITGDAADVSPYEPLEPKARQAHINQRFRNAGGASGLSASQNEWNLAGGVPIEDMAHVTVPSQQHADRLDVLLNRMLQQGRISERPTVSVHQAYGGGEIKELTRGTFSPPTV
jgi:hypothetical protein